jgi:hypothetical protein
LTVIAANELALAAIQARVPGAAALAARPRWKPRCADSDVRTSARCPPSPSAAAPPLLRSFAAGDGAAEGLGGGLPGWGDRRRTGAELGSGRIERLNYTSPESTQWVLPPPAATAGPDDNASLANASAAAAAAAAEGGAEGNASAAEAAGGGGAPGVVTLTFDEFDTENGSACRPFGPSRARRRSAVAAGARLPRPCFKLARG